jgi:hypothetical protein
MTPTNATPLHPVTGQMGNDELEFAVELWTHDQSAVEQILARAASVMLARAIFTAAKNEYPGRHIVLRHADRVVDQT